jgi:hypothetical protein
MQSLIEHFNFGTGLLKKNLLNSLDYKYKKYQQYIIIEAAYKSNDAGIAEYD